ncbi:hypothetical protein BDK51DRAFT_49550 [Blyttiomyces helicus]|uniref:Uncharacterized protein n=1 Tax=Blyttiomyces helicus TaxID=388810 RepID=A0A4P9VXC5_9FUNG|nr:hypothetical protein BDK51DRAFT_49550 [Blyttiomyces helicus]|eukprot:RKO84371.1 hypothetical protein BDK51DRAFT_49550 [Blyttiomyces helicus]
MSDPNRASQSVRQRASVTRKNTLVASPQLHFSVSPHPALDHHSSIAQNRPALPRPSSQLSIRSISAFLDPRVEAFFLAIRCRTKALLPTHFTRDGELDCIGNVAVAQGPQAAKYGIARAERRREGSPSQKRSGKRNDEVNAISDDLKQKKDKPKRATRQISIVSPLLKFVATLRSALFVRLLEYHSSCKLTLPLTEAFGWLLDAGTFGAGAPLGGSSGDRETEWNETNLCTISYQTISLKRLISPPGAFWPRGKKTAG